MCVCMCVGCVCVCVWGVCVWCVMCVCVCGIIMCVNIMRTHNLIALPIYKAHITANVSQVKSSVLMQA